MKRYAIILFCLFIRFINAQNGRLIPDTIRLCPGDTAGIEISRNVSRQLSTEWVTPYGIVTNTRRVRASRPGRYVLKTSGQTDSCIVIMLPRPKKSLSDTSICKGRRITLDARNPGLRYQWSTGERTQRISVDAPGLYHVRISNGSCETRDSARVTAIGAIAVASAPESTFCISDDSRAIGVRTLPDVRVQWNTGATTATIMPVREGTYWVRSEHPLCGQQTDTFRIRVKMCECEMMIPNSFTPNEDGRNDYFFPVSPCDYSYFMMTITDRWGNVVFVTNQLGSKWDGRFKGNLCPDDNYVYRIETIERSTEKKQVRTGRIALFR